MRFALIGAAGYVAPKHMDAIKSVGGELVAVVDPHDSVGVLDRYFPAARYFSDIERFDRFLEKCAAGGEPVDYVSVCSPNHLHDAHARLAMRSGCDVICEKPLVLNPWNLDQLERIEEKTGKRVHPVLQLRYSPPILELRDRLSLQRSKHKVRLKYVTRRGLWYQQSWKGDDARSGGILCNIGVHMFDLLLWLFGRALLYTRMEIAPDRAQGSIHTAHADIEWELSVRECDLPLTVRREGGSSWRVLEVDGMPSFAIEGFGNLHRNVYAAVVAGDGLRLGDARSSIEAIAAMRRVHHDELIRLASA